MLSLGFCLGPTDIKTFCSYSKMSLDVMQLFFLYAPVLSCDRLTCPKSGHEIQMETGIDSSWLDKAI